MPSLGHDFADPALLELALTHASTGRARDNERLEFLGDAVLDLVVAEELFGHGDELDEGAMTERKAALVSRRTLAVVATELDLASAVQLGRGLNRRSLSRSVLANLYEAVVGAIYLDGGYAAAQAFVLRSLGDRIRTKLEDEHVGVPKQRLQEIAQRQWGAPPTYELVEERGLAHAKAFRVRAVCEGRAFPAAWGRTVKEAESWAAFEALLVLEEEDAA
jgi:ribonuclease-3